MKSRVLTYILLPVVLLLWGVIFYRIFFRDGNKGSNPDTARTERQEEVKEPYVLKLDYRDPFLEQTPQPAGPVIESEQVPEDIQVETAPARRIRYIGLIGAGGKEIAILEEDGEQEFYYSGRSHNGITVRVMTRDSVVLKADKDEITLHME